METGIAEQAGEAHTTLDLGVVIPARNAASTLAAQLDALLENRYSGTWEIIVADNGSTDGTAAVLATYASCSAPTVRRIDASAERGVNAARNAGVRATHARKILICDADDVAAPGYVQALSDALDVADGAAGVMDFGRLNAHLAGKVPASGLVREGTTPVPIGACCAWRRSVWERLGGFDESWVQGCDDIQFALEAHRAGCVAIAVPTAVMHKRERHGRELFRQYVKYGLARPRLCKAFPDLAEQRSTRAAARHWLQLFGRVATGRGGDEATLRQLGKNLGRLIGSARHRYWAP
ncbi:MAG: glycosyltransferase [Planctomycetota bacterium]